MVDRSFVAIDFETATRHRSSACAVAVAVVEDGHIRLTRKWLIQPPRNEYEAWNTRIHGIDASHTARAPRFPEVFSAITDLIGEHPLLAHNSAFDTGVIRAEHLASDMPWPDLTIGCTQILARRAWPGLTSYSLPLVQRHLGLGSFRHHDPEADARACAEIMLRVFDTTGTRSLEDAAEVLAVRLGRLSTGDYAPCLARQQSGSQWNFQAPDPADLDPEHPFADVGVAFTGTLDSMARSEAGQLVVSAGGRFQANMSKQCSYLVFGQQDFAVFADGERSGKTVKAEKLIADGHPLQVISEDDFLRTVRG